MSNMTTSPHHRRQQPSPPADLLLPPRPAFASTLLRPHGTRLPITRFIPFSEQGQRSVFSRLELQTPVPGLCHPTRRIALPPDLAQCRTVRLYGFTAMDTTAETALADAMAAFKQAGCNVEPPILVAGQKAQGPVRRGYLTMGFTLLSDALALVRTLGLGALGPAPACFVEPVEPVQWYETDIFQASAAGSLLAQQAVAARQARGTGFGTPTGPVPDPVHHDAATQTAPDLDLVPPTANSTHPSDAPGIANGPAPTLATTHRVVIPGLYGVSVAPRVQAAQGARAKGLRAGVAHSVEFLGTDKRSRSWK